MARLVSTRAKPWKRSTIYSTNRMEAAPWSQSTAPRPLATRVRSMASVGIALLLGAILRVWMFKHFFEVNGDSLIYGGIAKNLLLHGRFALPVGTGGNYPTLIRFPGYPLVIAACSRLFGMAN